MRPQAERSLLIAGLVVLATAVVWGWARKPVAPANWPVPVADAYGEPVGGSVPTPCVAAETAPNDYSYSQPPPYSSRNDVRTIREEAPPPAPAQTATEMIVGGDADRDAPRPLVYHERSKKKSALIVAGGAGTGAAVGAIAGGGKGAGIGAIVGGAGSFIYDRLTFKHRSR